MGDQFGGMSPGVFYRGYQAPGETFRIVCQDPCRIEENLIFAKYAGFKAARQRLVEAAGIDILPQIAPFDLHLNADSWCGPYNPALAGDASTYGQQSGLRNSFGCFWDVEKTDRARPFTPENAVKVEDQLLAVHQYAHTLFFRRHEFSYEDLAVALSIYVSGNNDAPPGADACDFRVRPYNGVVYELCQQNGFVYSDLAPGLRELERLFRAGLGAFEGGRTSHAQYRAILDRLLGSSTAPAFLASHFTPPQVGGMAVAGPGGGRIPIIEDWVWLDAPPSTLPRDTVIQLGGVSTAPYHPTLFLPWIFSFMPADLALLRPVRLTLRYDLASYPPGVQENSLKLLRLDAGNWVAVPGAQLDTAAKTVSATIGSLGVYALFP